jgi:hypothetical protein
MRRVLERQELDGDSSHFWLLGNSRTVDTSKEEKEDMKMEAVIQRQTVYAGSSTNFSLYCELYAT